MSNRFVATELSIACLLALHYLGEDAGVDSLILCCEQFGSVKVLRVECWKSDLDDTISLRHEWTKARRVFRSEFSFSALSFSIQIVGSVSWSDAFLLSLFNTHFLPKNAVGMRKNCQRIEKKEQNW